VETENGIINKSKIILMF